MEYPFNVIASIDAGYVIQFPDLPGCLTQAEDPSEIVPMAMDAKKAWIETAYELCRAIPLRSHPDEYSGQFQVRVPRKLHRELAEAAERNGVSLNTWVVYLLSGNLAAHKSAAPQKAHWEEAA